MRKLSISEITTRDWSFEEDVRHYQEAGLDGIGVWWNKLKVYGVEEGRALLKDAGLAVSSLISTGHFTLESRAHLSACIDNPVEAIDIAAALEADCLAVVTGPPDRYSLKDALQIAVDRIAEIVPVAEQRGIRLALEPLHPMYTADVSVLNTLSQALNIVEEIDSPYLGLFLDTYHLWWDHELDTLIPRCKGRIFAVHVSDWRNPPRTLHTDRAMMGEGVIPLKHILGLIEDTGYDGCYEVEILSEELWQSDQQELVKRCRATFEAIWS